MIRLVIPTAILAFFAVGCAPIARDNSSAVDPVAGTRLEPVLDFQNPEDLVRIPDTDWLLVSEMVVRGKRKPGRLALYRIGDGARPPIEYRHGSAEWGQGKTCATSFDTGGFAPHGMDIVQLESRTVLLVVNHQCGADGEETGGNCPRREKQHRVELFEVGRPDDPDDAPLLTWRGCVRMPPATHPNDVAALPGRIGAAEGAGAPAELAFAVSDAPIDGFWAKLNVLFGWPTGRVLTWNTKQWECDSDGATREEWNNWCIVKGSQSSYPNGVAVSSDAKDLFFTSYRKKFLRRIQAGSQPESEEYEPGFSFYPDNLTWLGSDGCLVAVGATDGPWKVLSCFRKNAPPGYCTAPFEVATVDPTTLSIRKRFSHDAKSAFGFPSVALEADGRLYFGTPSGNRIARLSFEERLTCNGRLDSVPLLPGPEEASVAGRESIPTIDAL